MDKRIINAFAVLILVAWFTSFVLQAMIKGYDPPNTVNILATMLGGAAFGASTLGSSITAALGRRKEPAVVPDRPDRSE